MKNIELLAPCGNMQNLKVALHFGADAVYVGGKSFSLRAQAVNFSNDDLIDAVNLVHSQNKKIYVTVNIFAKNSDLNEAAEYFKFLYSINVDGVIISDLGLFMLCKNTVPELPIHISTQANTLNSLAVEFWHKQGAERVVLARELTIDEIAQIHAATPDIELECFIHGAMCLSYSGRCWLSNYTTNRDANRGECSQSCRWKYSLIEAKRPNETFDVEEDDRGSYILNSKDLKLIEHIPTLIDAGIVSFKVEGRVKTESYVAGVVNAYRRAINEYIATGKIENLNLWNSELDKISHRPYTTAFLLGKNDNTIEPESNVSVLTSKFVGYVLGYNSETKTATVEMRNRFKTGDTLEILSPSDSFLKTFSVPVMKDLNGNDVLDAYLVQQVLKIEIPYAVSEGDILRMPI